MRLLILVAFAYVAGCVLAFGCQHRLVYLPTEAYVGEPSDVGLKYEEVSLKTKDDVRLTGWFVERRSPRATVLALHGNAGNMSHRLHTLKCLHELGFSTLIIDYRGYGRSEGTPSERGLYQDAEAARRYLVETRGISPGDMIYYGRSLGGAVAIELASRHSPRLLLLEATFTNLADVARRHFKLLPVDWLLTQRFDSEGRIGSVRCPVVMFHGRDDALIPLAQGKRLFNAVRSPKRFCVTPGGHNDAGFEYAPEYVDKLLQYLDELEILTAPGG